MPRNHSDGRFMTTRNASTKDAPGRYGRKDASSLSNGDNKSTETEAIPGVGTLVDRQQRYFSKIAIDNEKLIYNKGQLEKSEHAFQKSKKAIKLKLAVYAYRANEKQK